MAASEFDDGISDDVSICSDASSTYSSISQTSTDDSTIIKRKKKLISSTTLGGETLEVVKKKRRKRKKKKKLTSEQSESNINVDEWKVLGTGDFGIDELRECVPDGDGVCFGVVSITIGSGKFARTKTIFIQFAAKNTPQRARGLATQKSGDAHTLLGATNANVHFDEKEEITLAGIFDQVGNLFVSDDLDVDSKFSSSWTLEEIQIMYQKQIEEKRQEYEQQFLSQPMPMPIPEKVDRITEILTLIHEDMGWVNWVLFKPTTKKLKLLNEHSFGGGTIYKMREFLEPEKVIFGLLRMSFGVIPYRRNHFVMLMWVGPKVPRIKRGKQCARRPQMYEMLQPHNIQIELERPDQVTVENIITRVRKIVTIDGEEDESAEIQEAKLMEDFEAALREEEEANAARDKTLAADRRQETPKMVNVQSTMKPQISDTKFENVEQLLNYSDKIGDSETTMNWMLIQHNPPSKKKKRKGKKRG